MTSQHIASSRIPTSLRTTLREHWKLFMTQGVLMTLLGALAIALPFAATLAIDIWIGWMFIISGVVGLVAMAWARNVGASLWALVTAVLLTVAGVFLITRPIAGALSITLVLAIFFFAEGLAQILAAIGWRKSAGGVSGWMIASGFADLVLAAIIFASWPFSAAWALGLLAGVNLITSGVALISTALYGRDLANSNVSIATRILEDRI